jgi:outer membrane protein assembly factor BamE (lipoprotein component of BamABCDE complex)
MSLSGARDEPAGRIARLQFRQTGVRHRALAMQVKFRVARCDVSGLNAKGTGPDMRQTKFSGMQSRRFGLARLAVVAGLCGALGGCLAYDGELQHGYVMDESLLPQVRVGSAAEQVLVVLGTPTTTSTVGGNAWYYISQKTNQTLAYSRPEVTDQRIYAVYFDKNKKVERVANYGMEDGKIIDFVTRTTPTSGAEQSFLQGAMKNLLRFS